MSQAPSGIRLDGGALRETVAKGHAICGRPVKVGYVIGSMMRGGAETHLAEVLPILKKRGYDVSVQLSGGSGPVARKLELHGIEVREGPAGHATVSSIAAVHRAVRLVRLAFRLWRFGWHHRHGIIHVFLPQTVILCGILLWPLRRRMIVSQRGLLTYRSKYSPIVTSLERFAHRQAALVVANSRAVADVLRADGVPEEKLRVIYNGLSESRLTPSTADRATIRGMLGLRDEVLVLVVVSNLHPYKGHEDLLAALDTLVRQSAMPADWVLLVVGRDEPDIEVGRPAAVPGRRERLVRMAHDLGLGAHVVFLGEREDVPELLRAGDIGVHPSHEEGFSNAIIEMMAAGLAIVATSVGGNAEALEGGVAGMLVSPNAPDEFATALTALVRNAAERRRLGDLARTRALAKFGIDNCADGYVSLYDDVLANLAA